MSITPGGTLGTGVNKQGGGGGPSVAITTVDDIAVGDLIAVAASFDNIDTSSGVTNRLSCTDSEGNTYTKIIERTRTEGGSGNDGVTVALFIARATAAVLTGGTITVTSTGNHNAKTATAEWFNTDSDVAVEDVAELAAGNTDFSTISLSGLPERDYLYLHAVGKENGNAFTLTEDSDYTAFGQASSTGGANTANQTAGGGYHIVASSTGDSALPVASTSVGDHIQFLAAIYEVAGGGGGTPQHLQLSAAIDAAGSLDLRTQKPLASSVQVGIDASPSLRTLKALAASVGIGIDSNLTLSTRNRLALAGAVGVTALVAATVTKRLALSGEVTVSPTSRLTVGVQLGIKRLRTLLRVGT